MKPLWEHQRKGLDATLAAIAAGERRICRTAPTGAGKTRESIELILRYLADNRRVLWLINRRLLLEQVTGILKDAAIEHGVRASGHDPRLLNDVQVSSLQTELSRVYQRGKWELHDADLVLIDEPHAQKGNVLARFINDYVERGAAVVGTTATPLGLGSYFTHLVAEGTNSELRACGAHVPCYTTGVDEPDMRKIKRTKTGEYSEGDVRKAIMTSTIFGRVYEWWKKLNPDARPAILFAPGVPESIWFAEHFRSKGVRAASIDGENIWLDGETYASTKEGREDVLAMVRDGSVKVICNRFVLREGLDIPELYHGIFATVFGSLQSFLQSGGRLLRSHPSLDHVIVQCHGGSYWRHGSLNADREWSLDLTDAAVVAERERKFRDHEEPEPILCPKCHAPRLSGSKCPRCGFEHTSRSRPVIQLDGSLRLMKGDIFQPRVVKQEDDTLVKWRGVFFSCRQKNKTFSQARGWFFEKYKYWPPNDLPWMPKKASDWSRHIQSVPWGELYPPPPKVEKTEPQGTFL